MEGAILLIMALGGLGVFGLGVILLVMYLRSGRPAHGEPIVYGNLVQCPRCQYMNPLDSAACLNCQLPFSHQRRPYQPPPSPTYPTLPPQYVQRPAPPPNAPYAPPAPNQEQTVAQSRPPMPPPASPPAAARMQPLQPPPPAANQPPGMPNAWLVGASGIVEGQRTVLVQPATLFGRSTQCDVQIYDPKVSRQHFVIRYAEGAFFLQDQGSSRGTMINGQRVNAQRLQHGDRIELGDTILVFHQDG